MSESLSTGADAPHEISWYDRFRLRPLTRVEMNGSAAVFGLVACLMLFSLALASDIYLGLGVLYAFPIGLSAWFFGRWVGAAMGAFAVIAFVTVALATRQGLGQVAVVVPALVVVTLVSIMASEWVRRSERLVRLLNQRALRH